MLGNDKHGQAGQSIFMGSIKGLANTAAVAVAFFATGPIHTRTADWITDYTAQNYGAGWSDLVSFIWFVIVALLAFFIARATLATLLVMGGLAIATRLF